jgi:replication-associated recombination protein RarA
MNLLHPATKATIDACGLQVPQGLIISGPVGVGLSGVAAEIAQRLKGQTITVQPTKDDKIDLEKGIISVDSIRKLYDQTKTITKTPRIVVIDSAEKMAANAQNAFLKLLEEPPKLTHFLLLTHTPESLLPTIHSRAQQLFVQAITKDDSEKLLDHLKVHDATKRAQLLFIASGLPAEIARLVADEKAFQKRAQVVRDARTLANGRRYEGLVLAQQYKDDRAGALILLQDAMKQLRQSAAKQSDAQQILAKINHLLQVFERVKANGNVRLQLAASVV